MADEPQPIAHSYSWFKATRSADANQLIRANPLAYTLAAVIAQRAWYSHGFNADGCGLGEAMIGDYGQYGMSRQQYRTALCQLRKWQFATTRATNKGTIAKLIDSRLFEITPLDRSQHSNHRATTGQPAANQQVTTNIELKNGRAVEKSRGALSLPPNIQEFFAAWNEMAGTHNLPKCISLQGNRKRLLGIRLGDEFFNANWRAAFAKLAESKFCRGENDRGWRASFDWLLKGDTIQKILEGKYDNNIKTGQQHINRNIGTTNEGLESQYSGLGRVVKIPDAQ